MKKLSEINKITLPMYQIASVYKHLREAGEKGVEGVALWSGIFISDTEFEIKSTIIPAQKAYSSEDGLLYVVEEEELHRINGWLYNNKQTLISQIHSHPGKAYHSDTDNAYPIIARIGGVSIVVPDFAFRPFALEDWAIYRLFPHKGWVELNLSEMESLIKVI